MIDEIVSILKSADFKQSEFVKLIEVELRKAE